MAIEEKRMGFLEKLESRQFVAPGRTSSCPNDYSQTLGSAI